MDVGSASQLYLNVRETAKRLGVHENTVRNWVRGGILPTARVPGSRFHRFDARDVERLRLERGASVSSIERERRTFGSELANATDLSQWATTRDAQDTFPELVRRLLVSTAGVTSVSVRAGEGVAAPGWDGRAESVGSPYLPSGSLCFEFGVGANPKGKADQDYDKRRADPEGAVLADSVFIFVTPRRWAAAAAWANGRRAERAFRDVRVLDADDLEGWLQATPAVHHWISEHLGRRPRQAQTLESWWARFRAQTVPALPAGLFLAGRERERDQLETFFRSPPGVVVVKAAWRSDALAFVCATIEALDERNTPVQPPLLVSSSEVWDRVVLEPGRMTLLPLFENPDIATASERGHHVVLPLGWDQIVRGEKIELPRPDRLGAGEALEAAGLESERTYRLAALARRSMPSLVRALARDPALACPEWSRLPAAEVLAPLVLVGAWTESDSDTGLVSRVTGKPWPEIERVLVRSRTSDDPPFVKPSNEWHLASPEEALLVLKDALTPTDLRRWKEIVVEVLLERDPRLDLAPEERPMAGVGQVGRKYSSVLRRGLAQGIALLGWLGREDLSDGTPAEEHAQRAVREILAQANNDSSTRAWCSLADELPFLAEAAPYEFLDAVHEDLDREEPLLRTMFQDTDRSSWLFTASPHTGLLWALETLCWSPEFLLDASRALARLHTADPGGRLSNRPLASLTEVLVGWIRHTSAPLDVRVGAVAQICRHYPDVGWKLIAGLWPTYHATSSPPHSPRFRDWLPESRGMPIAESVEYVHHLVELAIGLAGGDTGRWAELSVRLAPLPRSERARLLDELERVADPASLAPEAHVALWESIHKEVSRHQRFSSADWSMEDAALERLQAIATRLEPTDATERFAYLFDWHPDVPDIDLYDHDAYERKLLDLRTIAVVETLERASLDALQSLAKRAPVPTHLGWIVGALGDDTLTSDLLAWLDADDPKLRDVAMSWAQRQAQDRSASWVREMLQRPEVATPTRRVNLVLSAPPSSALWGVLAEVASDLSDLYWTTLNPWRVPGEDVEQAAQELLGHDRAWAAIDVLASRLHGPEGGAERSLPTTLVESALDAALHADPRDAQSQSLGYEIGQLLDYLDARGADQTALASYEFLFFALLEDHRQPRALFALLGSNPSLFVDLVSRVYRGKHQPRRQLDEPERALASQAWWVLAHWHALPGLREDGTLDGEHLTQWVREARLALADADREDIGDEQIGQVLAANVRGDDGLWPSEPVREIIEAIGSSSLETGIHIGVINGLGVTSRSAFEGGAQERALAAQYRDWSKRSCGQWPRTARMLRRLAEDFERQAQREDAEAEVRADTE